MPKKTLYLVTSNDLNDTHFVGIYSTRLGYFDALVEAAIDSGESPPGSIEDIELNDWFGHFRVTEVIMNAKPDYERIG